jgi:hypothetical protein
LILLIDRGDCTFGTHSLSSSVTLFIASIDHLMLLAVVQKVRLAQDKGAVAAIIVDNIDEPGLPFMADDGTGMYTILLISSFFPPPPFLLVMLGEQQYMYDNLPF